MSKQKRDRDIVAQPEQEPVDQWQRDYGQRNQRPGRTARAIPPNPDYSRDNYRGPSSNGRTPPAAPKP